MSRSKDFHVIAKMRYVIQKNSILLPKRCGLSNLIVFSNLVYSRGFEVVSNNYFQFPSQMNGSLQTRTKNSVIPETSDFVLPINHGFLLCQAPPAPPESKKFLEEGRLGMVATDSSAMATMVAKK